MFGRRKRAPKPPPPPCPDCGKPTNLGGRFCRACGWDADLEESADSHLDGVDVPDTMPLDDGRYAELLADEDLAPQRGRRLLWTLVAAALVVAFLWTAVFWI